MFNNFNKHYYTHKIVPYVKYLVSYYEKGRANKNDTVNKYYVNATLNMPQSTAKYLPKTA